MNKILFCIGAWREIRLNRLKEIHVAAYVNQTVPRVRFSIEATLSLGGRSISRYSPTEKRQLAEQVRRPSLLLTISLQICQVRTLRCIDLNTETVGPFIRS